VLVSFYLAQTRSLIQLPGTASTGLVTDAQLTTWINMARGQVAGEGECIRVMGTIPTVIGQTPYLFSGVNTGVSSANGVQGIINVQSMSYSVGSGQLWMTPRPWPWFSLYNQNNAASASSGPPTEWSQFSPGAAPGPAGSTGANSATSGSFYISPVPDSVYQLNCNSVCYPIPLALDADPEALPYFWTDAVPFLAAYFYLMSAQTNARMADAANMYKGHYNEFMDRARKQANAGIDRWIYAQSGDPAQGPKMGIKGGGQ
jgi:hypothetical protein